MALWLFAGGGAAPVLRSDRCPIARGGGQRWRTDDQLGEEERGRAVGGGRAAAHLPQGGQGVQGGHGPG